MIPKEMIERLRQLKEKVPLGARYTWKLPNKPPPGLIIPQDHRTPYEQNLFLKVNLRRYLERELEQDKSLEVHYWVIRDWGRIRRFGKTVEGRDASNNKERIEEFKKELDAGTLKRASFQVLPSLSKILSFWDPKQYAIYDSRAVFSLNWLLFLHWGDEPLFPQPVSRNKAIKNCDTSALYSEKLPPRGKQHAYHDYCRLLRLLSKEIYDNCRPFNLEMLLFVIADQEIIKDIERFRSRGNKIF